MVPLPEPTAQPAFAASAIPFAAVVEPNIAAGVPVVHVAPVPPTRLIESAAVEVNVIEQI
jgi:hypothetical protein